MLDGLKGINKNEKFSGRGELSFKSVLDRAQNKNKNKKQQQKTRKMYNIPNRSVYLDFNYILYFFCFIS